MQIKANNCDICKYKAVSLLSKISVVVLSD